MKKSTSVISSEIPRQWYRKRNVLIDIAVILVVIVIIAVIWWVGHRPEPADNASKVPQYSNTEQLTEEVHKKYGQNDYAGAVNLIKGQKTIDKTETQLLLANAYANQGDKSAALAVYDRLRDENKLTVGSLAAAGLLAEQANDNAKALMYYQDAVDKLQTDKNPSVSDHLPMYQAKVDELTKKVSP